MCMAPMHVSRAADQAWWASDVGQDEVRFSWSLRLGPGPVTESWLLPIGPDLGPRCGPAKLVIIWAKYLGLGPTTK